MPSLNLTKDDSSVKYFGNLVEEALLVPWLLVWKYFIDTLKCN